MSELSYKGLQEQGVFDVPYKAFKFMENQQKEIDELRKRIDDCIKAMDESICDIDCGTIYGILTGEQELNDD